MIRNYIKIAFRNLWKNKSYALINLVGLSFAFGCSILLFMTSYNELTFDSVHQNRDNIYRVYFKVNNPEKVKYGNTMAAPMREALMSDYKKEIKYASRVMDGGGRITYKEKTIDESATFVDADYIKIFSIKLLKGNANSALKDLGNVVLREDIAKNIFGNEDPMGKTFLMNVGGQNKSFVVTGVSEKLPDNTSIENDMLIRFENNPSYEENKDRWDSQNHGVYIQLAEGINWPAFELTLKTFSQKYFKDSIEQLKKDGAKPDERGEVFSTRILPFADEHFDKNIGGGRSISIVYPYTLLIISIFILLIACINFVNLSIARSLTRAKEVGMRKALGALKTQIVGQFWGEAFIICVSGWLIGLAMAYFFIPQYNAMFRSNLKFAEVLNPTIFALLFGVFALITLIAGGYPAWFVAKFNTIEVLKGKVRVSNRSGFIRNALIITQFTFSVLLICCTLIIWNQIDFLRNSPIGYEQSNVISIPVGNEMTGNRMVELFKNKLAGEPRIKSITAADNNLGRGKDGSNSKSVFGFVQEEKSYSTNGLFVDYDYIKTVGLKLIEGRDFSTQYATDSTEACIINESMAKQLGGKNLIGKRIMLGEKGKVIIGIVKDYHFESLKNKIESITLMIKGFDYTYLFVKIAPENTDATMALLEKTYKSIAPKSEFMGSFLDENRENQYQREKRLSQIFISAAILAIILSCLGLFAIALMMIAQRTKEIGIRKVLGSSVSGLVILLSKDFLKLVFVSIIIASPIAYYAMNEWLSDFAYQVGIQWWVFVVAGFSAILIAFLTVSFQSIRAALMNPVKSLKSE
jgi:ABC-type antimicrobial peptide transport system permease subunit